MASPTLDLLCCQAREPFANLSPPVITTMYSNMTTPVPTPTPYILGQDRTFEILFNVISIMTASLSIMGAIYTLIPKRGVYRRRRTAIAEVRQTGILTWLAVADLMACLGMYIKTYSKLLVRGSVIQWCMGLPRMRKGSWLKPQQGGAYWNSVGCPIINSESKQCKNVDQNQNSYLPLLICMGNENPSQQVDWLIDWLIDWLSDWLIDWLIQVEWLIDRLIDWLMIDWLIDTVKLFGIFWPWALLW